MPTQITPHFTLEEFFCKCDACKGKAPSKAIQANIVRLIHTVDPYRVYVDEIFDVNCGYRCPKHNKEVGGVANSVHMSGLACDITICNQTAQQMFQVMANMPTDKIPATPKGKFSGVGFYPTKGFVHVDISKVKPRPNTWKG